MVHSVHSSNQNGESPPQTPISYDAKEGETTTVAELKSRREQQENGGPEPEEDAALLAAGWKRRDRGDSSFWLHPQSDIAFSREVALKHLGKTERRGREY